jgi:hypothetical protein
MPLASQISDQMTAYKPAAAANYDFIGFHNRRRM